MSAPLRIDDRGLLFGCPSCGQMNRVAFARLADAVRCGACRTPIETTGRPLDVGTTADFERLVAHASIPVVVDYWAPWCGPCRMVAPELDAVAARAHGRYLIVKVNTDALPDLGERHRIRSIPTMAVFEGSREARRTTGARPAAYIERFILSPDADVDPET